MYKRPFFVYNETVQNFIKEDLIELLKFASYDRFSHLITN